VVIIGTYKTNLLTMDKTQIIINRILQVENFQNVACVCANWAEFVQELAEWGVDGCAKIDFDDPELDIPTLDKFMVSENGYERTGDDWNLIYGGAV
jgi:hypothetical protein